MSNPNNDFGVPDDFGEYLDKIIASDGANAAFGDELREAILKSCREVNDKLADSFKDLSSTGFELPNDGNQDEECDNE